MKVAIFGNTVNQGFFPTLQDLFQFLDKKGIKFYLYQPFREKLHDHFNYSPDCTGYFISNEDIESDIDFILSIGGDGTFLESQQCIRNYDIPVIGVNTGRLGFLADISQERVIDALTLIYNGDYGIAKRTMLELIPDGNIEIGFNLAINEIAVQKTDLSSMINIKAYINGELLNNYWADGLIIATPTGSTAYSLSVGGPIISPDSENFVISPIAPHNLTIRPIVVPDHNEITLTVEGRGKHFLTSLDSRSVNLEFSTKLFIKKANHKLRTIKLNDHSFFNTLRNKLMWGADKRN